MLLPGDRTQHRQVASMQTNVSIGVADETSVVLDADATQDDGVARTKAMSINAKSCTHDPPPRG